MVVLIALAALQACCCSGGAPAVDDPQNYAIPFDALSSEHAEALKALEANRTAEVNLPDKDVRAPADVYNFLLDHLDFTAAIVKHLGLGKYDITPAEDADTVIVDDKEGVKTSLKLAHNGDGLRVYLSDGTFSGGILPKIKGHGAIVVFWQDKGDTVRNRARILFKVDDEFFEKAASMFAPVLEQMLCERAAVFLTTAQKVGEIAQQDRVAFINDIHDAPKIPVDDLAEFIRRFDPR
jgi:hypothetical protein